MKQLVLSLFVAACLMAADATGNWAGTMTTTSSGGPNEQPAYLVLKQAGTKLTGNAGPSMQTLHVIQNGKIENGVMTFDVQGIGAVMKFKLKFVGDQIQGEITRVIDGQTQVAKLSVKRQK